MCGNLFGLRKMSLEHGHRAIDVVLHVVILRGWLHHLQGIDLVLVMRDLLANEHAIESRVGRHRAHARKHTNRHGAAGIGGVRLAQEVLALDVPVVLVTRSLRWIPQGAAALRELPWVAPDAGVAEVGQAIVDAMARFPSVDRSARTSSLPDLPMALVR